MQGENKIRVKQIENIKDKLLHIKEDKALTAKQKVEKAYGALSDLQAEIKKEINIFASSLHQLCEDKKEDLATLFPDLKIKPPLQTVCEFLILRIDLKRFTPQGTFWRIF